LKNVALVALATDGDDGPTNAAGAVVTGETLRRGRMLGLNPLTFLKQNDSYHYFKALDDLLMTGPSGTNVNDLAFLICILTLVHLRIGAVGQSFACQAG
jgi:glycerate 2-kinase